MDSQQQGLIIRKRTLYQITQGGEEKRSIHPNFYKQPTHTKKKKEHPTTKKTNKKKKMQGALVWWFQLP